MELFFCWENYILLSLIFVDVFILFFASLKKQRDICGPFFLYKIFCDQSTRQKAFIGRFIFVCHLWTFASFMTSRLLHQFSFWGNLFVGWKDWFLLEALRLDICHYDSTAMWRRLVFLWGASLLIYTLWDRFILEFQVNVNLFLQIIQLLGMIL